ncbi:hypothetical protein EVA_14933 [gut metagenome]|uniref:Uncharacterized protein n=1 Tax=gut metagenome TaxID=749906 RepID=J9CAK2_9ZZZZ
MTGTVAVSITERINPAPPRGINTSTYSLQRINSREVSLELSSNNCTAYSGNPASCKACCKTLTIAKLLLAASLPPFKIVALPDLKHNAKTSAVTLGRAS